MEEIWKVGAVAQTSGLTVRTLHHWDEIGLLEPSHRGAGGHREYTEADLARLFVILVLRDLGLPVKSIRACLDAEVDPQRVLTDQLAHVDATLTALTRLRERVARMTDAGLTSRHLEEPAALLQLMRDARPGATTMLNEYLTEQERDTLAEAAAAAGPELPYLIEVEWPNLYRRLEELRVAGAAPGDARVQEVVTRMDELSARLGGGREGAGAAVRKAWRDNPAAMSGESAETAATWSDLATFTEQARTVRASRAEPA